MIKLILAFVAVCFSVGCAVTSHTSTVRKSEPLYQKNLTVLAPLYDGAWDRISEKKRRIKVPQRIYDGCYKENAKVQVFGSPSQEDWSKALNRESEVHNDCTALQAETVKYLSEALGRLRNGE